MTISTKTLTLRWRDVANLIFGAWLFVSPWILLDAPAPAAAWNAHALGAVIALGALLALYAFHEWEEWLSVLFGGWLIVSPWVFAFPVTGALVWSTLAVGVLVALMALWSIYAIHDVQAHA